MLTVNASTDSAQCHPKPKIRSSPVIVDEAEVLQKCVKVIYETRIGFLSREAWRNIVIDSLISCR